MGCGVWTNLVFSFRWTISLEICFNDSYALTVEDIYKNICVLHYAPPIKQETIKLRKLCQAQQSLVNQLATRYNLTQPKSEKSFQDYWYGKPPKNPPPKNFDPHK